MTTLYRPTLAVLATVSFEVPGNPAPRPRPLCRAMKTARGWIGQMYHPKGSPDGDDKERSWWRANRWYDAVRYYAERAPGFPDKPWEGTVRLSADAYFERPQSMMGPKYPDGPILRPSAPDRDNLDKSITDALACAEEQRDKRGRVVVPGYRGLYLNDGQVCAGGEVWKWYAAKGAGPGLVVVAELVSQCTAPLFAQGDEVC